MSFEIKYNPDGTPMKMPMPEEMRVAAEQAGQQSVDAVAQEIEEPKVESPVEDSVPEVAQEVVEAPAPKASPKPNESWKAMRERIEAAERKAEIAEAALRNAQVNRQPQTEEDLNFSMNDDDLVEGKHLSKVDKKIKNLEAQLKQYEQRTLENITEARLKQQYPDFDAVVSKENIANLSAAYPELAASINHTPDLYSKAVTAYTMIKKLGLADPVDTYESDKAVAQRNAAKPKPLASIDPQKSENPLSRANAFATKGPLTEDMKQQAIREMNDARKGY